MHLEREFSFIAIILLVQLGPASHAPFRRRIIVGTISDDIDDVGFCCSRSCCSCSFGCSSFSCCSISDRCLHGQEGLEVFHPVLTFRASTSNNLETLLCLSQVGGGLFEALPCLLQVLLVLCMCRDERGELGVRYCLSVTLTTVACLLYT